MRAEEMLAKHKSIKQKALEFAASAERTCRRFVEDEENKLQVLVDSISDKENLSLEIDFNEGLTGATREQVEQNFRTLITLNAKKDLKEAEVKAYRRAYEYYFGEGSKKK